MKKILALSAAVVLIAAAIIIEIPINESLDIRCAGELVITPNIGLDIDRVICAELDQTGTMTPTISNTHTATPTATDTQISVVTATATEISTITPTHTLTPTITQTLTETTTHTVTPTNSAAVDRPRVVIQNGTVVTGDTNVLLRCETPRSDDSVSRNDQAWWDELRDDFHLNCVRIFARVSNGNEPASVHRADIQAWVDAASAQGFYAIIDYHLDPPGSQIDFVAVRDWWEVIAADHADRTHVLFELINEPPGGLASHQLQRWLYEDIRSLAPDTHIIFFSSKNIHTNTVNDIRNTIDTHLAAVPFTNESISFHAYSSSNAITNLEVLMGWDEAIINTEVGSASAHPDDETEITRYELEGISWTNLDGFLDDRIPQSFVTWAIDPYFE